MAEPFGIQLRSWRLARRVSQEALAARAEVSTRHLSFLENGRSKPSREVLLALACALDVPLRERNTLLTAAGFAAAYSASRLDDHQLVPLRRAIDHVLEQQEPYGAIVLDGHWNIQRMNRGALRVFRHFAPTTSAGALVAQNLMLGLVHPEALRPYLVNWSEVAGHTVARLHQEIAAQPADEERARLLARVLAQPDVPAEWRVPEPGRTAAPFVSAHLRSPTLEVRLFSMLTSIGTPLDVTAEEIHIESYFPADEATEAALRALAE
ncbi:MAG: helix-turn-helix transcriptional regulator [Deltaproteobacteria bacterium]|nr:helix-turn-helix transcriptional regulator [Deltaproteobacteria bacterium]